MPAPCPRPPGSLRVAVAALALSALACRAGPADSAGAAEPTALVDAAAPTDGLGLADAASADDLGDLGEPQDVSVGCPEGQTLCAAACLPACTALTWRSAAWDCACRDGSSAKAGAGLPMQQRLCLSVNVATGASAQAKAQRQFLFEQSALLGVHWLRWHFLWAEVEPKKGAFAFASVDTLLDELAQFRQKTGHPLGVLGVLAYGAPWASKAAQAHGNDHHYPPDDPQDFADYAVALALHASAEVHDWEVWNEQNAGYRFWKSGSGNLDGDPKAYAKLLRLAVQGVHQAVPTARVGYGGLFYVPQLILGAESFLAASFAAEPNLALEMDALAWHPYPIYPPIKPPEFDAPAAAIVQRAIDQTAVQMRALWQAQTQKQAQAAGQAQPGAKAQALWITEHGWPTEAAISEQNHARYLVRSWALAASQGVERLCWYTLLDQNPESDNVVWEKAFGLYRYDADWLDATPPQPKPAVQAHAHLAKRLHGLGFSAVERSGPQDGWWSLAFADAQAAQVVHVIWDQPPMSAEPPAEQTREVWLPARAHRRYALAQAEGAWQPTAQLPEVTPDAQGRLRLQIGPAPLYLVEEPVDP